MCKIRNFNLIIKRGSQRYLKDKISKSNEITLLLYREKSYSNQYVIL